MNKYFFSVIAKKFFNFTGRARRKEYWMYSLYYTLFLLIALILDLTLFYKQPEDLLFCIIIYCIVLFFPSLGVSIRRLHDTNSSGWWLLVSFIPVVGNFMLLYFMIKGGDKGPNEYGPDPKAETITEE